MTATLTVLVAVVVAIIAFLQWVTARQKVVLDLFDKRFAVYEELREVVGRHVSRGAASIEDMGKFTRAAGRAQFLFGPEVTTFLEERRLDLHRASLNSHTVRNLSQKSDAKQLRIGWSLASTG